MRLSSSIIRRCLCRPCHSRRFEERCGYWRARHHSAATQDRRRGWAWGFLTRRACMSEINSSNQISDIVARAEQFLNSGLIKTLKTAPPPKHEGKNQNRGKGRAFDWLCQHASYTEKSACSGHSRNVMVELGQLAYCGVAFKPTRLCACWLMGHRPPVRLRAAILVEATKDASIRIIWLGGHKQNVGWTNLKTAGGKATGEEERLRLLKRQRFGRWMASRQIQKSQ